MYVAGRAGKCPTRPAAVPAGRPGPVALRNPFAWPWTGGYGQETILRLADEAARAGHRGPRPAVARKNWPAARFWSRPVATGLSASGTSCVRGAAIAHVILAGRPAGGRW